MKTLKKLICLLLCTVLLAGCIQVGEVNIHYDGQAPEESADETAPEDEKNLNIDPEADSPGCQLGGTRFTNGEPVIQPDHEDNFVSVKDADPGMVIRVIAPAGYSTQSVLAGMVLKNLSSPVLTDPNETDLVDPDYLVAEAGGGIFSVYCAGGFNPGDVYQIELTDGSLCYEGQDPAVRLYNISVSAPEVSRMKLNNDVQFLSAADLNPAEAGQALQLDGMFRYDITSGALGGASGSGSFVYNEGAFTVGDVVAVYEGTRPDERSFADAESEVAYTRITAVNSRGDGTAEYQYEGAEQEDVLFVPDVIPVHQECLLSVGSDSSIMLESSALQFASDGEFSEMRLDENTEVEPGDFLAFYTGTPEDGQVTAYAEIMEVTYMENEDGGDSAELKYKVVSMEEMMSSIDTYRYATLSEAQIRSSYNEDVIKAQVLQELTNNGYLMESTYSLAETALDTEEAKELFGDTPLEQLTFYYGQNEEHSMSGREFLAVANGAVSNTVEVKGDPDVKVTPNIVHFAGKTGYGMGVRMEAYAKFYITIRSSAKAALKITITFFFETEVVMGYTVDATSIWKWKWIFPYIYDYSVTGSCANGIYIGAGFSAVATLVKNEAEKTEEELAAGIEWPEGVDRTAGSEKVMAMCNYIKDLSRKHDAIFPPQTTGGGALSEKYASFIKTADKSWVDLFNPNIFDWNGCIDPFHIIAFRLKADFVVSAQLNAAIGVGANYERSYKQTFNFMLIHKTSEGTQIDETDTSTFRADVYIFGAIGLRAGLRLTVAVGLFDARLDSIGLEVEGGLYARFWGYFYAGIAILDVGRTNQKTDMYYSGGLLSEVGAYYSVTFFAQVGDGAIAYRRVIAGDEYPFFSLGVTSIVSDFAYKQGDESRNFSAYYTKDSSESEIPANLFSMVAMSIKDGSVNEESRGGQNAQELFDISFDDPNFGYAWKNGKHWLVRKDNKNGGEGTVHMTLKWKGKCFEQLSTDLFREIEIQWEASQITMSFLDFSGNIFHQIVEAKGTPLTEKDWPQSEPEKEGYKFLGWLKPDGTPLETMPDVMPDENIEYTSDWYRYHVDFRTEYYMPFDHDEYGHAKYYLLDTDIISGILYPGDPVEDILVVLKENHLLRTEEDHVIEGKEWYQNYRVNTWDSVLSVNEVAKDGSTTFRICLEWDACTITFDHGDGQSSQKQVLPGMPIEFPAVSRQGYIFAGWQDADGNIVDSTVYCTGDATYTAIWNLIPPTLTVEEQVKVKSWGATYYWNTVVKQELVFDSYQTTVQELISRVGIPAGYVYDPGYTGRELSDPITIAEDGTTRIILRFSEDRGDGGSGSQDSGEPESGDQGGSPEESGSGEDAGSDESESPAEDSETETSGENP